MKASKQKKDVIKTIRINSDNLEIIEEIYGSVQKFIDDMLDTHIEVEVKTSIKDIHSVVD